MNAAIIALPHEGAGARVAPLGAMAVAAYLERECPETGCEVFDCDGGDDGLESLAARLIATKVGVVGFQIFSSQMATAACWAGWFRARLPDIVLVAGGHHPTLTWRGFVERHGHLFDAVVKGDGEAPFTEIVRRVRDGTSISDPPIPSVGMRLPGGGLLLPPEAPPLEICAAANMLEAKVRGPSQRLTFSDASGNRKRSAIALISSRSCPLQCSFCSIITMPGKWRANDAKTITDWLQRAHANEPFEHVYFMDANFFVVPRRVREIAKAISETLPDVTWSASSTVRMLLRMSDDIADLVQWGLRMVELGIESGSQRQLDILNKEVTVAENRRCVALLQEHRLQIGLDFIMFFPDQTVVDLRDNLAFIVESNLLLERTWDHLLNTLELYPGTPLRKTYEQMFGLSFDDDVLPPPLFRDRHVGAIHAAFAQEFAPAWLDRIDDAYGRMLGAARACRETDPERASELLLEAVALRHIPVKVLWALTHAPFESLRTGVPWLDQVEDRLAKAEALIDKARDLVEAV